MFAYAQDQHVTRRTAAMPALMFSTDCDILLATSSQFEATPLGWSTMVMASLFCPQFIRRTLDSDSFEKLQSYLNTGKPHIGSVNDGRGKEGSPLKPVYSDAQGVTHNAAASDELFAVRVFEKLDASIVDEKLEVCVEDDEDDADSIFSLDVHSPFEKENEWRNEGLLRASMLTPVNERRIKERAVWSPEQDRRLLEAFKRYGGQWRKISRILKLGTDDRLRNRWERMREGVASAPSDVVEEVIRLTSRASKRPYRSKSEGSNAPKRAKWDIEEDDAIIAALKSSDTTKRPSWKQVSESVEGRTPHAIRNRAYRLLELGRIQQL